MSTLTKEQSFNQKYVTVMNLLEEKIGEDAYGEWFSRVKAQKHGNICELTVPTDFLVSWISEHYLETISGLWHKRYEKVQFRVKKREMTTALFDPSQVPPEEDPVIVKNKLIDTKKVLGKKKILSQADALLALRKKMKEQPTQKIKVGDIKKLVSIRMQVTVKEIDSTLRTEECVLARQFAMYLAKKKRGLSLSHIGKLCGDKDHTTVLYAIKKITSLIKEDEDMRELHDEFMEFLKEIKPKN